jgi:Asparagine synthase (glutamine-hydrolyzing)
VKSVPYLIGPEEFLACLPRIIWQLDDPMADAAAIPLWFAAREARKHVKVVLSGEGADELFGGYGVYHQPGVVRAGQALPGWGRSTIGRVASELPTGARGKGFLSRTSTPLRGGTSATPTCTAATRRACWSGRPTAPSST